MSFVLLGLLVVLVLTVQIALHLARRRSKVTQPAAVEPMRQPVVPYGTFVAPTHGWLRFTSDGAFRVGIDDFLAEAIGHVEEVALPELGTKVERNDPLVTLRLNGQRLVVPAPASGEVVKHNALAQPHNLVADPYGLGWLLELRPQDHKAAIEPLYVGNSANAFLRKEYQRLVDLITTALATPGGAQGHLADGAMLERGAVAQMGPELVAAFSQAFLSPDETR